ncbi:MAG: type II toxin-antitoxin system RelE/ParE family toxin [Asticcacaulis sp.]
MRIRWLPASRADIARLYEFLYVVSPPAAARRIGELLDTIEKLPDFPRIGHEVDGFQPQEVRSWIAGDYEIRYELAPDAVVILRIWHAREDR